MTRAVMAGLGAAVVGVALMSPWAPPVQADTTVLVADWQMNDSAGSQVMADSSPNNLDGQISSDAAAEGLTSNGEFFTWSRRCPACVPASPGRVVQVPDSPSLDIPDPNATYTLEFRFRTTHGYGNYMQKGQSTTKGGQIKVQGPGGTVQCLFKGADGTRVGTGSPTPLDDGQWHTVQCVHTATQVRQYVDGVRVAIKNGSTGPIDNKQPFTIGGKSNCDQGAITCDYFSGDIDYVRVWNEQVTGNIPPNAAFNASCEVQACSFDASGASDPDGSIVSYSWTFGDGSSSTAVQPSHTYAGSGNFQVALAVTDDQGARDTASRTITIDPVPPARRSALQLDEATPPQQSSGAHRQPLGLTRLPATSSPLSPTASHVRRAA